MIPSGICLDLETTITMKIPDHIRRPGYKRYETRIIEIGAVLYNQPDIRYQALVNPICKNTPISTPKELFQHLSNIYQHPTRTLNFWSRVLVKRQSVTRDMLGESPEVWLARQVDSRAKTFVHWHNHPEDGPSFMSEKVALLGLIQFTKQHNSKYWLAHNGKSFDYKVLQGCAERHAVMIPENVIKLDTLKLFRKHLPGHKSYSQPIFYESLFGQKYNAHVAIDDAIALSRLCSYCNENKLSSMSEKKTSSTPDKKTSSTPEKKTSSTPKKKMNLTFGKATPKKVGSTSYVRNTHKKSFMCGVQKLRGIGPKSAAALSVIGVHTIQTLKDRYHDGGDDWLKSILPYGVQHKLVAKSIIESK